MVGRSWWFLEGGDGHASERIILHRTRKVALGEGSKYISKNVTGIPLHKPTIRSRIPYTLEYILVLHQTWKRN